MPIRKMFFQKGKMDEDSSTIPTLSKEESVLLSTNFQRIHSHGFSGGIEMHTKILSILQLKNLFPILKKEPHTHSNKSVR